MSDAVISLRILARAADAAAARAQIEPVERTIRERLGDLVFGADEEDLQELQEMSEQEMVDADALRDAVKLLEDMEKAQKEGDKTKDDPDKLAGSQ